MIRPPSPANFDPIAGAYRWMERLSFGHSLERCRSHFLPQLGPCRRALALGDGDGRFLARLLAANPALEADAVDSSASMLHLLQRRARASGRLRTHHTGALTFAPTGSYDLIVTHFFLDCLTPPEIETLCGRIRPHLTPNAIWLVSEFRVPSGAMHWPARILIRALYLAFRFLTGLRVTQLPEYAATLTAAGLTRTAQHHTLSGLLISELWVYTPAMQLPPQRPKIALVPDPVPDPEPASPSLPEPDPGVFHHEPDSSAPGKPQDASRIAD